MVDSPAPPTPSLPSLPNAVQARPLEDGLSEAIDEGKVGPRDDPKIRSKILSEEFGWDKEIAKKIWCFGPDTTGEPPAAFASLHGLPAGSTTHGRAVNGGLC